MLVYHIWFSLKWLKWNWKQNIMLQRNKHECHLLRQMTSQQRSQNYFKDWYLMNLQPNLLFLTYFNSMNYGHLSKGCKPDNFEPHNSLKLSFTNNWGLRSNFVECESFLELNPPDIIVLSLTNLDDSIDSGNFSVRGYLPLIWKDYVTNMQGLAVYVKEGILFACDLSLENCRFLLMFLTSFTSLSVLLLFPLSIIFFVFVHGFWFYFI